MSNDEIRELARVFQKQQAAGHLLDAAGFPRGRHPTWAAQNSEDFWRQVSSELSSGVLHDGRHRVLAAAHSVFPANVVFAAATQLRDPPDGVPGGTSPVRSVRLWRRGPLASPRTRVAVAAGLVLVLAGVSLAAGFALTSGVSGGRELRLELAGKPTLDAFMPPVGQDEVVEPLSSSQGPVSGVIPAETVGLYGGTRNAGTCDRDKMVRYLRDNPPLLAAWTGVLQVKPADLDAFVKSLTPVVLRADTLVTNHGYKSGSATSFQAVLQAGTAVLVNGAGVPVVKCGCGNPLTRPAVNPVEAKKAKTVGEAWPRFSKNTLTQTQPHEIPADVFVLVDVKSDQPFTRERGSAGEGDHDFTPAADTDWLNTKYHVDCAGEKSFTAENGVGTLTDATGTYELRVLKVAVGDLAGSSHREVAVLLSCGASGSPHKNLLYVYYDGPNILDHPQPPLDNGQQATDFTGGRLAVENGLLVTEASFPSTAGSGTGATRDARFLWNGQRFVPTSLTASPSPGTSTPGSKKENISGTWRGELHITQPGPYEAPVILEINQNGSSITGTISSPDSVAASACGLSGRPISGTLDGDKIEFAVSDDPNETRFEGQVQGDTIAGTGTSRCYDGRGTWSVRRGG
ncbi:DUF6777 domain-containing protein [Parafrankia discariae]|uniref:DUF6777 domain-containing protein n=1 Tax=Parafrankia discariae TaxID=365528 RepID=UPI001E563BA2|nr:DUF6777 domain-containing protein [Parafrankia discariae]